MGEIPPCSRVGAAAPTRPAYSRFCNSPELHTVPLHISPLSHSPSFTCPRQSPHLHRTISSHLHISNGKHMGSIWEGALGMLLLDERQVKQREGERCNKYDLVSMHWYLWLMFSS